MEQEIALNEPKKLSFRLQKRVMRLVLVLIVYMVILLLSSCTKSKGDNPFAGNEYVGTIGMENVRFSFEDASNVEAIVTSVEFVGNFKDVLKGTYVCDSTMAVIHWTAVGEKNDVYKAVPLNEDMIILDSSQTAVMFYSQGKVHKLKEHRFWGIGEAFGNANGFGDIMVTIVLSIILALFYAVEHWYITLPILIVVLASLKYLSNGNKKKIWNKKLH